MRILITGATGLIGQEVVKLCHSRDIKINYLTTSREKIEENPDYQGFFWNPKQGDLDANALLGVEAIIHLAGAPISERWTSSYKEEIIESRIHTASLLYSTLQKNENSIKHFISASGVDVYAHSYHKTYTEDSEDFDNTFLSNVVLKWEEAADKFANGNCLVSKIRTGAVLDGEEGALPRMARPVKYGVGAPLGNGRQYMPWIHIRDIAGIYVHMLTNKLEGIYNAVAPETVTNKEMTKEIAKQLDKPLWLPNVPPFVLKLMLGEMAQLVLCSHKVSSEKIRKAGYDFKYPEVRKALGDLL